MSQALRQLYNRKAPMKTAQPRFWTGPALCLALALPALAAEREVPAPRLPVGPNAVIPTAKPGLDLAVPLSPATEIPGANPQTPSGLVPPAAPSNFPQAAEPAVAAPVA